MGIERAERDGHYKSLYKFGGWAALSVAFLTVIEVAVFAFYPQPDTVRNWFLLFQANPILGLVDFWGLEVLMYAMFVIVFLALYVLLKAVHPGGMLIALTIALLGIAIFFATNNPFSMFSLSRQYAAATTETKSLVLAAGEAVLAATNQRAIGGFNLGLFFVSVAGLMISVVMLYSPFFPKRTAYVGLAAFGLSLADYMRQALTPSVTIALVVILAGAVLLVIWFVLVGRRLLQLGR